MFAAQKEIKMSPWVQLKCEKSDRGAHQHLLQKNRGFFWIVQPRFLDFVDTIRDDNCGTFLKDFDMICHDDFGKEIRHTFFTRFLRKNLWDFSNKEFRGTSTEKFVGLLKHRILESIEWTIVGLFTCTLCLMDKLWISKRRCVSQRSLCKHSSLV